MGLFGNYFFKRQREALPSASEVHLQFSLTLEGAPR
jgi:hypothetical protein